MCRKCVDAVHRYFPDCPDEHMGDFLVAATCWPLGCGDDVERQLREHREAGCATTQDAIRRTDAECDAVMRNVSEPPHAR